MDAKTMAEKLRARPQVYAEPAADLLERQAAERAALLGHVVNLIHLAEFWIDREDRSEMSEQEWKTWHALGHGSEALRNARAVLSAARAGGGK